MKIIRLLIVLVVLASVANSRALSYWVETCKRPETGCRAGDPDLAQWAMEAWASASGGRLKVVRSADKDNAHIRFYWVTARDGLYGETRGGDVYVRAESSQGLTREAIVYLTCLHESGHALGLVHTSDFQDIMYNFQFGGDIEEYFGRYVRKLSERIDIRKHSGISEKDSQQLRHLLAE